jgi:hypothetical protein
MTDRQDAAPKLPAAAKPKRKVKRKKTRKKQRKDPIKTRIPYSYGVLEDTLCVMARWLEVNQKPYITSEALAIAMDMNYHSCRRRIYSLMQLGAVYRRRKNEYGITGFAPDLPMQRVRLIPDPTNNNVVMRFNPKKEEPEP